MGSIGDNRCYKCGRDMSDDEGQCPLCAARPAASIAMVKARLLQGGYDAAIPAMDNAQYDLVFYNRGLRAWQAVQVKTAYNGKVNTCRPNSTGRRPYDSSLVDWFAIVDGDDVYMLDILLANNGGRMSMEEVRKNGWHVGTQW